MNYVTKQGIRLSIGRIPRLMIDKFLALNPMPEPPTKAVPVFGDIEEEVAVLDDPIYQVRLNAYYLEVGDQSIELIAPAVKIEDKIDRLAINELIELRVIKEDIHSQRLRFLILSDPADLENVVNSVFYQSTVTPRGLLEAIDWFGVKYMGKFVSPFGRKFPELEFAATFTHRMAANNQGYSWPDFCELWGAEQSKVIVMDGLSHKVQKIISQ